MCDMIYVAAAAAAASCSAGFSNFKENYCLLTETKQEFNWTQTHEIGSLGCRRIAPIVWARTNAEFKWATSCFQSLSSWPSVQISQRNMLDTKFQNAGHQSAAASDTTSILYNKRFSAVTSTRQHSSDPELHHCITKLDLFLLLLFWRAYFRS